MPPIRDTPACGVLVSAAIVCAVGGSADDRCAGAAAAAVVALAICGLTVPAAPATATPFKKFRRSTLAPTFCVSWRAPLSEQAFPIDIELV